MSEISVEKFERLQNRLKKIEPKLAEIAGMRKTKRAQTKQIYEKWNVESLSELRKLKEEKEEKISQVMQEIEEYVTEMEDNLEKLDEEIL